MMKRFISIALSLLLFCVMLSNNNFTATASSSSVAISFSNNSVIVGDNFTVTVNFSSGTNIGAIDASLIYDQSDIDFVSMESCTSSGGNINGSNGTLKMSAFDATKPSAISFTITFAAKTAGFSAVSIANPALYDYDENALNSSSASATIQIYTLPTINNEMLISEDYISCVTIGSTADEFIENLNLTNGSAAIYTPQGANTDNICTGNIVKIFDASGNVYKSYTIVVFGDINGDGSISSIDLLNMQIHILGYIPLTDCYLKACDVDKNNVINSLDLLNVQQHILGLSKIIQ